MVRAKITGVKDLLTAKTAEESGAGFISFVFDMDSKDYVPPERAMVISIQTPATRKVGIFANADLEQVNNVADKVGLDYIQLNGDESDEYIRQLHRPVIKRYNYDKHKFSPKDAEKCPAEMILLDIGKLDYHNEKISKDIASIHKSVIVAGKIDKENILQINRRLHPYAVDVSIKLAEDGKKNIHLIHEIMRRAESMFSHVASK